MTKIDYTNRKYGMLTFIRKADSPLGPGRYPWVLRCDCGNEVVRLPGHVVSGPRPIRSCGCSKRIRGYRKHKEDVFVADTSHKKMQAEAQKSKMVRVLSTINGLVRGLSELDVPMALSVCTREDVSMWANFAGAQSVQLAELSAKLKKGGKNARSAYAQEDGEDQASQRVDTGKV